MNFDKGILMTLITPMLGEDLLELGKRCGAVYICPRVGATRTGKLVAYAGKDSQNRNLVGDIYFNFHFFIFQFSIITKTGNESLDNQVVNFKILRF